MPRWYRPPSRRWAHRRPQTSRMLGVAAVLSLVVGVALACVIERLRYGFSLPEQLESTLGLPLIAMLPNISLKIAADPAAKAKPRSPSMHRSTSCVASCASWVKRGPRLLMVTSALPKDGKSVFAASLARNAAAAGWRVLLVDCDFGCPTIAKLFGLPAAPGLREILAGGLLGDTRDRHAGTGAAAERDHRRPHWWRFAGIAGVAQHGGAAGLGSKPL